MRAAVTDPVDVGPRDVRQRLDVASDVGGQHPQLGCQVVGEVRQVVVVAWVQHQHQRHADPGDPGQPPVVVEPDALVAPATRAAVRRVLTLACRLGQHRRPQRRDPQSVRLERADLPAGHPGQRQPALAVRGGDGVVVELAGTQCHGTKTRHDAGRASSSVGVRPGIYLARSKRSRFMTLSHAATKSRTNFSFASSAGVDLGERPELGVRAEDEVDGGGGPLDLAGGPVAALVHVLRAMPTTFHSVPMSSRFTKKSLVSVPGRSVKTPCCGLPGVGVQGPHAADEHRHLGRGQRQHVGPLEQQRLRRQLLARLGGSCGTRRRSARARRTTRRRSAPARRRCAPARTAP